MSRCGQNGCAAGRRTRALRCGDEADGRAVRWRGALSRGDAPDVVGIYTAHGANWARRGRPVFRSLGVCTTDLSDDPASATPKW